MGPKEAGGRALGGVRWGGAKESPGTTEDSWRRVWPTVMSQERRPASGESSVPSRTIWNNRPTAEETHLSWQEGAASRDLSADPS